MALPYHHHIRHFAERDPVGYKTFVATTIKNKNLFTIGYHHNHEAQIEQRRLNWRLWDSIDKVLLDIRRNSFHWTLADIVNPYFHDNIATEKLDEIESHLELLEPKPSGEEVGALDMVKRIHRCNSGWPWQPQPDYPFVTRAPYGPTKSITQHVSEDGTVRDLASNNFKYPKVVQSCPLLRSTPLSEAILPILFRHHSTASAFAATCQDAFELVAFFAEHWNITDGELLNSDNEASPMLPGLYIVVTPFRKNDRRDISTKHKLRALQNLTKSIVYHGSNIRILHLHRIPMLTVDVLRLIVPMMTDLRVLGIYRCPLIHIGHLKKLLDILQLVRPNSQHRDRPQLDFSPRWHKGPENGKSYGVTWNNFGRNSCLGIWQLVAANLPRAISQGVDLVSPASAFRQWLELGLLFQVPQTLEAILYERDALALATQIDYGNTGGNEYKLKKMGTYYFDCDLCHMTLLGIFFSDYDIKNWEDFSEPLYCLGCHLIMYLEKEQDHEKKNHTNIVRQRWLRLCPTNLRKYGEEDENGRINPYITNNAYLAIDTLQILNGLSSADKFDKHTGFSEQDGQRPSVQLPVTGNTMDAPVVSKATMAARYSFW